MRQFAKIYKATGLVAASGILFGVTGGCLPENFFAGAAGDLLNSLILAGVNVLLAGVGIQV